MNVRSILSLLLIAASLCAIAQRTVKPGDRLRIDSSNPSLRFERRVTVDGYLHLPVAGTVNAAGLSLEALDESLRRQFVTRGLLGSVSVALLPETAPVVSISGSVDYTGDIPWAPGRHLSYVLAVAHPSEHANLSAVKIFDSLGRSMTLDAAEDPTLRPGDQIQIPESTIPNQVMVLGGVKNPGAIPFEPGMTAQSAIKAAGGITGHGDPSQISVERNGQKLDAGQPLKRGDIVRVGLVAHRLFVSVQGAVANPGVVEFRDGMTLTDVIDAAGGVTSKADLSRVEVKSIINQTDLRFDLAAIRKGVQPNVQLVASDVVDVPLLRAKKP